MFVALYLCINLYVFIRGWQSLPRKTTFYILYTMIFMAAGIAFGLSVYFRGFLPEKVLLAFKQINRFWFAWVMFFFLAALFADLLRVLNHFYKIFPARVNNNLQKVRFIYFLSQWFLVIIISIIGFKQYDDPKTTELNLSVNKDMGRLESLRIVAVSDLHLGPMIHEDKLAEWIEMMNKLDPDVVLLVGDIFSYNFNPRHSESVIEEFRNLSSKYGTYAVLGNHEYYFDVDKSVNYFERSGIILLCDRYVTIDSSFVLAGRDDFHNRERKTLDSLLTGVDPSLPLILMDHQPILLHESVKNKIDLQISGHTHAGQIFPFNHLASIKWELVYGYLKIGDSQFYVTSGLGIVHIPIRLGTRSEIVHIMLKGGSGSRE